jgi:hypothetical protein
VRGISKLGIPLRGQEDEMLEDHNPGLVDISTVVIDKALPDRERYAEYKRQVRDPLHYIAGKFSIIAYYPPDAGSLEGCLRSMMPQNG